MLLIDNYHRAVDSLRQALDLMAERELSPLERLGVIQVFKTCWELGWRLMADCLQSQGDAGQSGARDVIREAFRQELIGNGQIWMSMLQDRNRTAHTYNEATMLELLSAIRTSYAAELITLAEHARTNIAPPSAAD